MRGEKALRRLLEDPQFQFDTVLDVGAGEGLQAVEFAKAGRHVTALDPGSSVYAKRRKPWPEDLPPAQHLERTLQELAGRHYDLVWASHVLEHQRNPGSFLVQCSMMTDSLLCVTVPPCKNMLVGGHLTLWTKGLLVYNLVANGIDCSEALVCEEGYDISVIVRVDTLGPASDDRDAGDIREHLHMFPEPWQKWICQEDADGSTLPDIW